MKDVDFYAIAAKYGREEELILVDFNSKKLGGFSINSIAKAFIGKRSFNPSKKLAKLIKKNNIRKHTIIIGKSGSGLSIFTPSFPEHSGSINLETGERSSAGIK